MGCRNTVTEQLIIEGFQFCPHVETVGLLPYGGLLYIVWVWVVGC